LYKQAKVDLLKRIYYDLKKTGNLNSHDMPSFNYADDTVKITFQVQNPAVNEECVAELFDLVNFYYPPENGSLFKMYLGMNDAHNLLFSRTYDLKSSEDAPCEEKEKKEKKKEKNDKENSENSENKNKHPSKNEISNQDSIDDLLDPDDDPYEESSLSENSFAKIYDEFEKDIYTKQFNIGIKYDEQNKTILMRAFIDYLIDEHDKDFIFDMYKLFMPRKQNTSNQLNELTEMGIGVIKPNPENNWNCVGGYTDVKENIQTNIILPYTHPELLEKMYQSTRKSPPSFKGNVALFEGTYGVGKTMLAKIIASELKMPLVEVNVQSIMSKWFGESEKRLAKIFSICKEMPCVLFLDELDCFVGSRDGGMHEATGRVLSVLLTELDGITSSRTNLILGATNHADKLDGGILSRFNKNKIYFRLPEIEERTKIYQIYAKHLDKESLQILAENSEGFSGRDIKGICEVAEKKQLKKIFYEKRDSETKIELVSNIDNDNIYNKLETETNNKKNNELNNEINNEINKKTYNKIIELTKEFNPPSINNYLESIRELKPNKYEKKRLGFAIYKK